MDTNDVSLSFVNIMIVAPLIIISCNLLMNNRLNELTPVVTL